MSRIPVLKEEVAVPKGTTAELQGGTLVVKGPKGTVSKRFTHPRVKMSLARDRVTVETVDASRREKAMVGTWVAHVRNLLRGVNQHYVYTMKAVYAHFPIKMTVKGNELVIENFLGERSPRKARFVGETKVAVKGQELVLEGPSVEDVSQTAANIENITRVRDRDPRVFQDGIFITSKGE